MQKPYSATNESMENLDCRLSDADVTVFWTFRPATVYHNLCAYEQKIQFFIVFEKAVDSSCIVQVMQFSRSMPCIKCLCST